MKSVYTLASIVLLSCFLQANTFGDALITHEDGPSKLKFGQEIVVKTNIIYGAHPKQHFDVYVPKNNISLSPVIFMVHGGAWKTGDKASKSVVQHKVNYWVNKGFIVISTNYRLLPGSSVHEQASDIRLALKTAQTRAASWGGDKDKFILMGHSAGAHLVSLVSASKKLPILGTISLDSAALDVEKMMQSKHLRLYDDAFGKDPTSWKILSPFSNLEEGAKPYLLVCSTKRDDSCAQADAFASKAKTLGIHAKVLSKNMSHKEINEALGSEIDYTQSVHAFIETLLSQ